jgi:2-polyprenyl-3-methyl-5-hydroxy-6-metoxy-1,4-benzoquinol methylase
MANSVYRYEQKGIQMTIRSDPENNETRALFHLVDFSGQYVLEIGCGDGRLTRRYADKALYVVAIDPFAEGITQAKENTPPELQNHVEFHHSSFLDFAAASKPSTFDIAILSWSL